ncbi:MAG: PLD nuclease N-terminal domain-containing protein [Candidatus Nanopelagicales bacterium]|nr:PLD nuclease N-terminal domain-containing protein [Candidatus Nanopelagicales bacterium]
MGRFVLAIAAVALHLYVLVDLTRARSEDVRLLPRWLWFLVSLMPVVGPAAYLLAGQPRVGGSPGGGGGGPGGIGGGPRPRGPVAPDDDPDFLKRLDEQSWAARMEQLRRQRETGGRGAVTPPPADADGAPGQQAPPPARAPDEAPGEGATR